MAIKRKGEGEVEVCFFPSFGVDGVYAALGALLGTLLLVGSQCEKCMCVCVCECVLTAGLVAGPSAWTVGG